MTNRVRPEWRDKATPDKVAVLKNEREVIKGQIKEAYAVGLFYRARKLQAKVVNINNRLRRYES